MALMKAGNRLKSPNQPLALIDPDLVGMADLSGHIDRLIVMLEIGNAFFLDQTIRRHQRDTISRQVNFLPEQGHIMPERIRKALISRNQPKRLKSGQNGYRLDPDQLLQSAPNQM